MEAAVDASAVGKGPIVVAGAGYAGLHAALRLTARLRGNPETELVLADRHDYHQVLTGLPIRPASLHRHSSPRCADTSGSAAGRAGVRWRFTMRG